MIAWRITKDTATPALRAALDGLRNRRPLMKVLGRRLEAVLRKWFKDRAGWPTKRATHGWPTKHFWDFRIRNATAYAGATANTSVVTVADPAFAAHYYGTTIKPKEKQYLSIPITGDAYKAGYPSAKLIEGVFLVKLKKDGRMLLARKKGKAGIEFLWRLLKKVVLKKDPLAAPPQDMIDEAMTKETNDYLTRLTRPKK